MGHLVPSVLVPFRVPPQALLSLHGSEGVEIACLQFSSAGPSDLSSRFNVTLNPQESADLTAVCVWFELGCGQGCCTLSTAPSAPATHWQQAMLSFYPKVVRSTAGVPLRLQFDVFPSPMELGSKGEAP